MDTQYALSNSTVAADGSELFAGFDAKAVVLIKGSPGSLMSWYGDNESNLTVNYLQFFNSTLAPSASAVPFMEFLLGVSGNIKSANLGRDFFSDAGVSFSTGIAYGWSSTSGSFTAITTTTNTLTVTYE